MFPSNAYVIRLAGDADELAIEHLAEANDAPPLQHPILVGEIDGLVAAALDLDANVIYTDPFLEVRTLPIHLRLRAMAVEAAQKEPDVAKRISALLHRRELVFG